MSTKPVTGAVTDRKIVNKLFAALRGAGIFARQRYSCCQGCAWSEAQAEAPGRAVVFYHRQDAEAFNRHGYLTRPLMIRFGHTNGGDTAVGDSALAERVVAAAKSAGLSVEWPGTVAECIRILPSKETA